MTFRSRARARVYIYIHIMYGAVENVSSRTAATAYGTALILLAGLYGGGFKDDGRHRAEIDDAQR